jgi:hypothetical protein
MKQLYTLIATIIVASFLNAQTHVSADPAANWSGYMAWFNHTNGVQGAHENGSNWALGDMKTTFTASGDTTYSDGAITLQPNFNLYGDGTDAYWANGSDGNKFMEGTSKVEIAAGDFTDGALSFAGSVASNTIDAGYTVVAFIKTLDPNAGYATIINQSVTLGATGTNFAVSANDINSSHIVQYGFTVSGMNANPADEAALGSVIVTPTSFGGGANSGGGGASTSTTSWDFEDASQIDDWTAVGDLVKSHVTTGGNPDGAIKFGGTNTTEGSAPQLLLEYVNANFDYSSAATAKIKFDLKVATPLVGTAIHFMHETQGVAAVNTYNLENQGLNDTDWTPYSINHTLSGDATGLFKVLFNFAAGAAVGHGGELLMDNFVVELYDSSGNVLSIQDLSDNTFMIYPNPVQNTLNVSAAAAVDSISIFDLTGREVLRAAPNAAAFSLDVATLKKGLYLVSLKAGDQEMTTKLVK